MNKNALAELINKTSIISNLYKIPAWNDDPPFTLFASNLNLKDYDGDGNPPDPHANGASFLPEMALTKAVFEAFERFGISYYKRKNFYKATYEQISKKHNTIRPSEFCFFSEVQLKKQLFHPFSFSDKSSFYWTSCINLKTKNKILIPAQLIYCPYKFDKEKVLMLPISTGAAAGLDLNDCLYKGMCELIERDSFILSYLFEIAPQKLIIESTTPLIEQYLSKFKKFNLKVDLYKLHSDFAVPTILAVIRDNHATAPAIVLGLKTDLNLERAITGSIDEAFQLRMWIRNCLITKNFRGNTYTEKTILRRALFWSNPRNTYLLNFILNTPLKFKVTSKKLKENTNTSSSKKKETVLNMLSAKNVKVYYKNVTLPSLKKLGVVVIKCISPDLHPLYIDENYPYHGGKRIDFYRKKYEKQINLIIHPFL